MAPKTAGPEARPPCSRRRTQGSCGERPRRRCRSCCSRGSSSTRGSSSRGIRRSVVEQARLLRSRGEPQAQRLAEVLEPIASDRLPADARGGTRPRGGNPPRHPPQPGKGVLGRRLDRVGRMDLREGVAAAVRGTSAPSPRRHVATTAGAGARDLCRRLRRLSGGGPARGRDVDRAGGVPRPGQPGGRDLAAAQIDNARASWPAGSPLPWHRRWPKPLWDNAFIDGNYQAVPPWATSSRCPGRPHQEPCWCRTTSTTTTGCAPHGVRFDNDPTLQPTPSWGRSGSSP